MNSTQCRSDACTISMTLGLCCSMVVLRLSLEELVDLLTGEWAGVPDLTSLDVPQGLAEVGGNGEVILDRGDWHVLVEVGQDDFVLRGGQSTGGQVTDQPLIASSW